MSNSSEDIAGRIVLRKMTQADLEIASDLAMLANPFASKERYRKFLTSQVEEFPDLTFVAATHCGESVIGYVTADVKEDEACIEDIAVAKPWQGKGIGKSLLTHIIKLLERRQIRRIKVEVHYKCSSAIPFYYVFGFRFASCVRDRFGKGEDATTLVKEVP